MDLGDGLEVYIPLCRYWCRRYYGARYGYTVAYPGWDDLEQEAALAAWQAHNSYDASTGYGRNIWVSLQVRDRLHHLTEKLSRRASHELSNITQGEDASQDALFGVSDTGPWGQAWFRPVDLRDCIDALPDLERKLVWLYYWLDLPLDVVARKLYLNHVGGSQAHQDALRRLRVMLDVPEPEVPHATAETCRRGHPWTAESTYYRKSNGGRMCKVCGLENDRRRRAERLPRLRIAVRHPHKVA